MPIVPIHGPLLKWVHSLPMRSALVSLQVRNGLKADVAGKVIN